MVHIQRGLFLIAVLLIVLASCQKVQEDKIPPIINLVGRNPDTILLGCNYIDKSIIAIDDKDDSSALTIITSGEVDPFVSGTYFIEYSVVDSDSNRAFEQRMVIVKPLEMDYFEDSFTVTDTLLTVVPRQITTYPVTIDWLSQNQNLFRIINFNNFGDDFELLIQPDSTGNFQITYEEDDINIIGEGWVKCDLGGLRMTYDVELPDEYQIHEATYNK